MPRGRLPASHFRSTARVDRRGYRVRYVPQTHTSHTLRVTYQTQDIVPSRSTDFKCIIYLFLSAAKSVNGFCVVVNQNLS